MSKSISKTKSKLLRKQNAQKKAGRKRLLIIGLLVLIALGIAGFGIYSASRKNNAETYSGGGQTIHLFADGKFSANLAHGTFKSGTYTRREEGGRTTVSFIENSGAAAEGSIENNRLRIPNEWDDGHGHGNILPKVD